MELEATIVAKYSAVAPMLDERSRRRWAAAESAAIGYGGDALVSSATGLARETIRGGRREIAPATDGDNRSRIRLTSFWISSRTRLNVPRCSSTAPFHCMSRCRPVSRARPPPRRQASPTTLLTWLLPLAANPPAASFATQSYFIKTCCHRGSSRSNVQNVSSIPSAIAGVAPCDRTQLYQAT